MLFVIALILISAPFLWWLSLLKKYKSLDAVPGPKPIPVLGNALQIGRTPQDFLQSYMSFNQQYGKVCKFYIANEVRIMISDPKLLEHILSSNVHITKSTAYSLLEPWLGNGLLMSTGKKWKSRRKITTPTFHFKILEQFMDVFNSCGDVLISKLKKESENTLNVYPFINRFALDVICETSMGVKVNAQQGQNVYYVQAVWGILEVFVQRAFSSWKRYAILFQLDSWYKKNLEYLKVLHDFSNNVITRRRLERMHKKKEEAQSEDGIKRRSALLDTLLESENSHGLTHEDIREEIDTFMFEGHDTTTAAICFTLLCLAENPDVQQKVYEEILEVVGSEPNAELTAQNLQDVKYLERVIKESLRLYPSVPIIERVLESDWSIGNYNFPKGAFLSVFIYAMHRSPELFPEPNTFNPDRFLPENQAKRHSYSYVPFSAGPRNCIGQKYAMFEMKSTILKIVSNFKVLPVPNFKPDLGLAAVLKSYNGVRIRLQSRHSE